jgi:hypothetical protein
VTGALTLTQKILEEVELDHLDDKDGEGKGDHPT